ncbi:MAG: TolC family protein [Rhodothalassiaceae bacterium]
MKAIPILILFAAVQAASAAETTDESAYLTLDEAVTRALAADDPSVQRFEEEARALEDRAVAESQLPDPQIGVTMQNLPTSIDFNQENMTQLQTKLRQSFPAGRTLALRAERRQAESHTARAAARLRQLEIRRETRLAWLELFYWLRAQESISKSRQAVVALEEAVRADYAAGRTVSQELMRARLEVSLLDDRLIEASRKEDEARADLARWVGEAAARRPLPEYLPGLKHPETLDGILAMLPTHPAVERADSLIEARSHDIAIAEQQYKPDWSVELGYGYRDGNSRVGSRDDFITAGITLDIPLFTGKRQDRSVSAARRERSAANLSKQALLLDMRRQLERGYAAWLRLGERVGLYEQAVIARAEETTQSSLTSYESGFTDFAELIRARLAELDAELALIRLRVERAEIQAGLLFLEGEI